MSSIFNYLIVCSYSLYHDYRLHTTFYEWRGFK